MSERLVNIEPEAGVQRWALSFVGGDDTGNQPKSCFVCPFLYINQKRCQIHGPDIVIDRVEKDGEVYTPVCTYQRGGTPLAVGDDHVVYNATVLGEKAADQTGLEWAESPTGTNCGGFKEGAPCEYFKTTDDKGKDGICKLMAKNQDEVSNAMSKHKGREVDWDDCCDGHDGDNIPWREAQKLLSKQGGGMKHWMQHESEREKKAGTKGVFSAAAKRKGMSTHALAEKDKHAPGKEGQRARMALMYEAGRRHRAAHG